jgi:hypothetical protein
MFPMHSNHPTRGTFGAVATVVLLVLALSMIAMSVSVAAQHDFSSLPQLVEKALRSVGGAS